ncbi:MAG TPA: ricin-type beta-trefoil lectin domain protein [Streptosporangiaceae bacterium]
MHRIQRLLAQRVSLAVVAVLGAACCVLAVPAAATPAAGATAATTINVSGTSAGRTFDGIGAISGGGGNTRLLTDYPAAQQQQILDYLFKPGYGADLQILKVEIGGDTNSTDGSESSIEHTSGAVSCGNGYEFWLMEQAKARNPNIKLYGLAWGAPGWIGGGNFWSTDMINYLVSWLNCAKADGLTINYLGGWNERGYNISWYEQLRSTLNADGYAAVQIVGADSDWSIASDIASNSTFASSVSIIGVHYPCQGGDGGNADTCPGNSTATSTGKPLWASENGSQDLNSGAPALIRSITRGYTDAGLTAYINWPVVAAIYPDLPYNTDGLILANQPWSGAYSLGESLWATAQFTQFTQPGWQFLNTGSGYLGGAESNGSYVSLKSTNGTDYSTIIETTTATAAQTVNVTVGGGLSTGTVHVWATNVNTPSAATNLVQQASITPSNGSYSLTVQPGYVYTLTTTTGQGKGTAASPGQTTLTLPYSDSFDGDTVGQQPRYLSQMQGAFEVEPCVGRSGQCVQQQSAVKPIEWDGDSNPYTIGGNLSWSNYTVSADALIRQAGSVQLIGRAGTQHAFGPAGINEYYLQLSNTGAWSIVRNNTNDALTTLASGTVAAPGTGTWQHLALTFNGSSISAAINGTTVGTVTDSSWASGMVGFGTSGYQTDQFDNLSVALAGSATPSGHIVAGDDTADCVDVAGGSASPGTKVEMWTCDSDPAAQTWTMNSNGTVGINGQCLDVTGASTADGALIEEWTCNGGANQQWLAVNGELVNPVSGKCLDDPGFNTTGGTQLDLWTCNGGSNQQWSVP